MVESKLNSGQLRAVSYTEGPSLILAGPGSGKTFTITEKVVNLIENGLKPDRILALTFSEKAAGEMEERIENIIGTGSGIDVSTFHSFCNNIIREFSFDLGINSSVRLISKEHSNVWGINHIDTFGFENIIIPHSPYDLIDSLLEGVSQFHDHLILPSDIHSYVDTQLSSEVELDEEKVDTLLKLRDLARFYDHYQQYKHSNSFLDYDDMISKTCLLLENNNVVKNKVRNRYDYILVDEFQDTNYSQLYLVNLLSDGKNLTCVADDDQCIYRFRGAYLSNIRQLQEYYPDLEKIALELNYRSTSQIVELSRQLIGLNPEREEKEILSANGNGSKVNVVKAPDDASEAEWVASEVNQLVTEQGLNPSDIYILTRKRADGKKFSDALRKYLIPVEYVGSLQLNQFPIVQEAIAYMRVVANPFNNGVAFAKVFGREGLSEHNLQKINMLARKLSKDDDIQGDGIYSVLLHHLEETGITQEALISSVIERLEELTSYKKNHLPSDTVKHLLMDMTDIYRSQLQEDTAQSRKNLRVLNSLIEMVEDLELIDGGSEFETVIEYLDLVFNLEIEDGESSDDNTVKIMTIHQSKGKEAKAVFVCDMAARHLPLRFTRKKFTVPTELAKGVQRDADEKILHLEEERRLAYVAMTRAKEQLYLVFPERYTGNKRGVKPSEFLEQIGYTDNSLVEFIEAPQCEERCELVEDSVLKRKKDEFERLARIYMGQGQLRQAVESLVVLAQIQELEQKGNLQTFDASELLRVSPMPPNELEALVDGRLPPLVDGDMRFSASGIRMYEDCPLKFKYSYVLKIPTPQKTFFQVGTDVHAVYEQMSKLNMQGETPDISKARELLDSRWNPSGFSSETQEHQEYDRMQRMLDFWMDFEIANPNETVEVEEWFDLNLDGAKFGGYIDRIDRTPDEDYIVIDYKTNKNPYPKKKLSEDIQIALYCLAVKEKYGRLPVQAGHMYVNPDVAEMRLIDVSEEGVEAVVERVREIVDRILIEDFEVREEPNCRFCDYKGICGFHEV
ncbi:ATP-dependent helicase [Methanolobus bombayensis]|uniref:ATP-dependent helicase n=1 Tax=Methanolobus bombayensis TaxID=38023 RepID=UPI001AE6BF7A|nr:ATP-dependent DNA helicase [Methanolobus bombayensis]MBP1908575.1 DNA helicase-2/ATP-dependent DNA helicase PcrA [Methanolobus bombayensis]